MAPIIFPVAHGYGTPTIFHKPWTAWLLVSEGGTNNPLNGSPSPLFCTPCSVVGLEPAVRLELTYLHSIKNGLIPGIRLHYPYMLY